jgi:hypothetical protein
LVLLACLSLAASRSVQADATDNLWRANTAYKAGDQVSFGGLIYQVMQDHTSQAGWEPPKVSSLFVRPVPPSCRPWQVQTSYGIGSISVFGGKFFRALQAHDSLSAAWTPDAAGSLWSEISGIGATCPIEARYCCTSATAGTGAIRIKAKGCVKVEDPAAKCRTLNKEVVCNGDQIFDTASGELNCF